MPTPIQRRAINDDLNPNWDAAEHALRSAREVIDWCAGEHINLAGLEARDLHTAMGEMPAERQSPADFLDVACALANQEMTRLRSNVEHYQRKDAAHERFVSDLFERLKAENFDDALAMVRHEHEAIHGPSDGNAG